MGGGRDSFFGRAKNRSRAGAPAAPRAMVGRGAALPETWGRPREGRAMVGVWRALDHGARERASSGEGEERGEYALLFFFPLFPPSLLLSLSLSDALHCCPPPFAFEISSFVFAATLFCRPSSSGRGAAERAATEEATATPRSPTIPLRTLRSRATRGGSSSSSRPRRRACCSAPSTRSSRALPPRGTPPLPLPPPSSLLLAILSLAPAPPPPLSLSLAAGARPSSPRASPPLEF